MKKIIEVAKEVISHIKENKKISLIIICTGFVIGFIIGAIIF